MTREIYLSMSGVSETIALHLPNSFQVDTENELTG